MFLRERFLVNFSKRCIVNSSSPIMIHPPQEGPCDQNATKHMDILDKIGPLTPRERLKLWLDMPINEALVDLAENING